MRAPPPRARAPQLEQRRHRATARRPECTAPAATRARPGAQVRASPAPGPRPPPQCHCRAAPRPRGPCGAGRGGPRSHPAPSPCRRSTTAAARQAAIPPPATGKLPSTVEASGASDAPSQRAKRCLSSSRRLASRRTNCSQPTPSMSACRSVTTRHSLATGSPGFAQRSALRTDCSSAPAP